MFKFLKEFGHANEGLLIGITIGYFIAKLFPSRWWYIQYPCLILGCLIGFAIYHWKKKKDVDSIQRKIRRTKKELHL